MFTGVHFHERDDLTDRASSSPTLEST
jgi:hypothetical protein